MFSSFVNICELLDKPFTFALGGPRTGKTTLLEKYVLPQVAQSFQNKPYLLSLIKIRTYWTETEEIRSRVSAALLRGILLYSEHLHKEAKEAISKNLKQNLSNLGIPSQVSPQFIELYLGEYWNNKAKQQQIDPLRWSLEMFRNIASDLNATPYLLLDDADFQIRTGILGEVLHLCKTYQVGVLASVRSLCDSKFDSENLLAEYARVADFLCLDFLPTDPMFRSLCTSILNEQAQSEKAELKRTANRVQLDDELFDTSVMLSGGQIGRFREVIQFMASLQDDSRKWYFPNRLQIVDFCESRVGQMLQREGDSSIKEMLKQWVTNFDQALESSTTTLTWLKLPVDQIDETQLARVLSIVRSGVLVWVLQCDKEERINVAKQTRFIPARFKLSPLAAIAGGISLKKALGSSLWK
ncbi:MAG: hypothetical protein HYX82_01480 [Chloroflexi bacterium]|nr:hypothetical protein [Chloroflexota bacterium]